jgi:hypothetical protein
VQAQLAAAAAPEIVTDASQLVVAAPVEPPPPAPVPPPPTPAPTPPQDTTDWKNKALTLEGMLRAQVPELKTRNTLLESQIAQLQAQVEAMKTAAARPPEPPPKATVDPRDVEAFGESMMDMVQRYVTGAVADAEAKMAGMSGSIEARLQALENMVNTVGQRTDDTLETQFWSHLQRLVPEYESINDSQGWQAWLSEVDTLTGVQRQVALSAAQKARNAERVAAIFNLYLKSLPPSPAAALASQVSPSPGGAGAAPVAAPARQLISEKFINDFYRDMQRGKYVGREAEAQQIEAAIHQAAAEGRVVR